MGKRKIELKLITDKKARYVSSWFYLIYTDLLQQTKARSHQEGHGAGNAD